MRVRVHSVGPLPTVKAWYEVSTGPLEQRTIADLKAELCQALFNVLTTTHKTPLTPANIVMELDEFELLDSSLLNVIRENDLLVVKYKVTPVSGVKRKREEDEEKATVSKYKTRKRSVSSSSPSSSSSSSTSSSSSSSDSSSSTSSSSSDSDNSDSDSDSDTGTPPSTTLSKTVSQKTITSKRAQPNLLLSLLSGPIANQNGNSQHQTSNTTIASRNFVPPGEGKLSTQQRNQRRRKKRMAEKAQDQDIAQEDKINGNPIVPSTSGSVSTRQDIPTPTSTPTSAPDRGLALAMSMAHVTKNDNKRRGFKEKAGRDLGSISGAGHTTFTTGVISSSSSSPFKSSSSAPRLVPPSERTDLPGNIIVTSVDVEWDLPSTKGTGTGTRTNVEHSEWAEKWTAGVEAGFVPAQREAPVQLDGAGGSSAAWDWEEVEKGWEGYPELVSGTTVEVGWVLLWKELALHPVRFTPEVMVHAATVKSVTEQGVELGLIPRVEPEEVEDVVEEEVEMVSRRHEELVAYRVYPQ